MHARHDKRQGKCKNGIPIIPFNITPYICLQMTPICYLIKTYSVSCGMVSSKCSMFYSFIRCSHILVSVTDLRYDFSRCRYPL